MKAMDARRLAERYGELLQAYLEKRSEALLSAFEASVVDGTLLLRVKKKMAHLVTETAVRRLEAAAQALGLKAETKIV